MRPNQKDNLPLPTYPHLSTSIETLVLELLVRVRRRPNNPESSQRRHEDSLKSEPLKKCRIGNPHNMSVLWLPILCLSGALGFNDIPHHRDRGQS